MHARHREPPINQSPRQEQGACRVQHMTQPWEGGTHHPGQPVRAENQGRNSLGGMEGRSERALHPSAAPPLSQALDPLTPKGTLSPEEDETQDRRRVRRRLEVSSMKRAGYSQCGPELLINPEINCQNPTPDLFIWVLLRANITSIERPPQISHLSPTLPSPLCSPHTSALQNPCIGLFPNLWSSAHTLLAHKLPEGSSLPVSLPVLPGVTTYSMILGTVFSDLHTLFHCVPVFERGNIIISHSSDGNAKDRKISDLLKGHTARKS